MAQFADRHAAEREPVGVSKSLKPLDRFDNVLRGWRRLGSSSLSEQTGGVCIDPHTVRGSLAGKFGLKLQPDLNGDGHQQSPSGLSPPYPAGISASSGQLAIVKACGRW